MQPRVWKVSAAAKSILVCAFHPIFRVAKCQDSRSEQATPQKLEEAGRHIAAKHGHCLGFGIRRHRPTQPHRHPRPQDTRGFRDEYRAENKPWLTTEASVLRVLHKLMRRYPTCRTDFAKPSSTPFADPMRRPETHATAQTLSRVTVTNVQISFQNLPPQSFQSHASSPPKACVSRAERN